MNKKNLTRVAGLSAAAMLALSGMAMAETTESALVKGVALNLRETASLDAKVLAVPHRDAGGNHQGGQRMASCQRERQNRIHVGKVPE